jgi:hypothetical protein
MARFIADAAGVAKKKKGGAPRAGAALEVAPRRVGGATSFEVLARLVSRDPRSCDKAA